jgi:hypothetical protein
LQIKQDWIQWVLVLIATVISSLFLALDLWPIFKASDAVKAVPFIGLLLAANVAFGFALKILFF